MERQLRCILISTHQLEMIMGLGPGVEVGERGAILVSEQEEEEGGEEDLHRVEVG